MKYNVLLEASGSLTSSYLIKSVKDAGANVTASDVTECAAMHMAHDFIIFPFSSHPNLWGVVETEITNRGINVVIPSFDETLLGWAKRKEYFKKIGVHVILSNEDSISKCQDKWETYKFFKSIGIPTPETSLDSIFPLIKPRLGRGGKGITMRSEDMNISMHGMISQELIEGQEYTIDVFCDNSNKPIYIIPRKRLQVKDGKSTNGITVYHEKIISYVEIICSNIKFVGPINIQCFEMPNGEVKFIEINPRIAGGMALGFAASENWVKLILNNLIEGSQIDPFPIKYGLKMFRHYDEVFSI